MTGVSQMQARVVVTTLLFTLIFALQGCGSSGGSASRYTVSGTVSGLSSTGLVLQNNGGDDLPVAGASFEFATALDNGSSYAVTILSQPTNQICTVGNANNTIDGANVTDVAVTCRNWQPAVALNGSATSTTFPDVGFDANGNAIAVWAQDGMPYANRYTAGIGWGTAVPVGSSLASNAEPRIVVDSSGAALAVWVDDRVDTSGYYYDLWSSRYTPAGGWEPAERIDRESYVTTSPSIPGIAMDPSGNALVVWSKSTSQSTQQIWSNRYTVGQGWRDAEPIERNNANSATDPQIEMDSTGNALAVFGEDGVFYANRYDIRSGWSTEPVVVVASGSPDSMAMNADGDTVVVWDETDGTRFNIWAIRYSAASGWGTAELIENDDTGDARYPDAAIDASGNAIVAWEQHNSIYANHYSAATNSWGSAGLIENDDAGVASNVEVAFDADGNAIATWQNNIAPDYYGWANTYSVSNGWGTAGPLDADNSKVGGAPRIAFDRDGNAIVVWGQVNLWASHYE